MSTQINYIQRIINLIISNCIHYQNIDNDYYLIYGNIVPNYSLNPDNEHVLFDLSSLINIKYCAINKNNNKYFCNNCRKYFKIIKKFLNDYDLEKIYNLLSEDQQSKNKEIFLKLKNQCRNANEDYVSIYTEFPILLSELVNKSYCSADQYSRILCDICQDNWKKLNEK